MLDNEIQTPSSDICRLQRMLETGEYKRHGYLKEDVENEIAYLESIKEVA